MELYTTRNAHVLVHPQYTNSIRQLIREASESTTLHHSLLKIAHCFGILHTDYCPGARAATHLAPNGLLCVSPSPSRTRAYPTTDSGARAANNIPALVMRCRIGRGMLSLRSSLEPPYYRRTSRRMRSLNSEKVISRLLRLLPATPFVEKSSPRWSTSCFTHTHTHTHTHTQGLITNTPSTPLVSHQVLNPKPQILDPAPMKHTVPHDTRLSSIPHETRQARHQR
jgi:hypothetical protein